MQIKNASKHRRAPPGLRYFEHGAEFPREFADALPQLAINCGTCYDAYLVTEPNREYLWLSDGSGCVGFVTRFGCVTVAGGLITPDNMKNQLVQGLLDFAKLNQLTISVFNVDQADRSYFHEHGFEVTHFAQDFVADLSADITSGKKYRDLRQRIHSIRDKGFEFKELKVEDFAPAQWRRLIQELIQLERENLTQKAQKEPTRIFQGNLTETNLGARRLFVAFSKEGRADAFIICNPYRARREWGLETYRYRMGTANYVLRALIYHVMHLLKAEGIQKLSLGIVPALNCQRMPKDSPLMHFLFRVWTKHLRFMLNIEGVHHFKQRFRPIEERRYVCVYPKASLKSSLAVLLVWGIVKIDLKKFFEAWLRSLWSRLRKRWKRQIPVTNLFTP